MSRNLRSHNADAAAPPAQIKHLAFTTRGYAIEDKMERNGIQMICAYKPGGAYAKALQQWTDGDGEDPDEDFFRDDLEFTARELGDVEFGLSHFVIVGYMLREQLPELKKMPKKQGKRKCVGLDEPEDGETIEWDEDAPPVLVVTEVLPEKPEAVQLWALVMPKNGLCRTLSISQEFVFYRWEFRDETTVFAKRGPNWNTRVSNQAVKPGMGEAPLTGKQHRFKRARDQTKLAFDVNVSLSNEIASLAASYVHTNDQWFLKEIKSILEYIDGDVNFRPLAENSGLRGFVESEEALSDETYEEIVSEFAAMWPATEHLKAEFIKSAHAALLRTETLLEYRFIKPFLIEVCWNQGEGKVAEEGLDEFVRGVIGTMRRTMGSPQSAPSISTSGENAVLALTRAKLKDIKQAAMHAEEKAKDAFGDVAFDLNSNDIWAKFGAATDTDTARAAWSQQLRLVIAQARNRETGVRGMVGELVEILDRLNLDN